MFRCLNKSGPRTLFVETSVSCQISGVKAYRTSASVPITEIYYVHCYY